MDMPAVPRLALFDQKGRWIQPGVPADACGQIRNEVSTAVTGLKTTRVSTRVVRELQPAGSATSNCNDQHIDQVWSETSTGPTGGPDDDGRPISESSPAPAYICTYRVPTAEHRTEQPASDLISVKPLNTARHTSRAARPLHLGSGVATEGWRGGGWRRP
ncbi:hypothetical protein [Actinoplanes sp. NPDC026623]|uniref:hypothetical protein n=1 Tax=Actinoplanes sp. NPDC026623 TaxID=3155610 RepID=UPI0033FC623B